MISWSHFFESRLLPAVYAALDRILPEFEFRRQGRNWVSTNTRKLSGADGQQTGKVYCWEEAPYCLKDFREGTVSLVNYVIASACHPEAQDYKTAVKYLCGRVHVVPPAGFDSPRERERFLRQEKAASIWEAAFQFCRNRLLNEDSPQAQAHRDYLRQRGFEPAACTSVGYLGELSALNLTLSNIGYTAEEIAQHLQFPRKFGKTHTLILPFRDAAGHIVGVTARSLEHTPRSKFPKYLNSKSVEGVSFKGEVLFNLRGSRSPAELVVVEGLFDALQAEAAGIENAVALAGARLTEEHLALLERHKINAVTLCLDNDTTGREQTLQIIRQVLESNPELKVYVARLPHNTHDPDSLIRQHGAEAMQTAVAQAVPYYQHYYEHLAEPFLKLQQTQGELTVKQRDDLLRQLVSFGAKITKPLEREDYLALTAQVRQAFGISSGAFSEVVNRLRKEAIKEQQQKAYRQLAVEVDRLAADGKLDRIEGMLGERSRQIRALDHYSTFQELLTPLKREEVQRVLSEAPAMLSTGYALGEVDLQLPSGAISLLAAPTSHGKTSFLINIALQVAMQNPAQQVVFFSYEESREAILLKALNAYAGIRLSKNNRATLLHYYRTGSMAYADSAAKVKVFQQFEHRFYQELVHTGRLKIVYSDYGAESLADAVRFLRDRSQTALVVVDYMQLLKMQHARPFSRQEELKQVCLELKNAAVETGLPLLLGAQFNRTVVSEQTMSPMAIGEAGDIERIANLLIGFFNRRFTNLSIDGNRDRHGRSIPAEDALYVEILKGRDVGTGYWGMLDWDGNTGKVAQPLNQEAGSHAQLSDNAF